MTTPLAGILIERRVSRFLPAGGVLVTELPLGVDHGLPPAALLGPALPRRAGFLVVSHWPLTEEETCRAIADFVAAREKKKKALQAG